MTTTTFIDNSTLITAAWLNSVNQRVYADDVFITDPTFGYVSGSFTVSAAVAQAAINATQGTTRRLVVPGNISLNLATTGLSITAALKFIAIGGRDSNVVSWTSTTMVAISVATTSSVIIEGFHFTAPGSCTAGGCIKLDGNGGTPNSFSTVKDNTFSGGYIQVDTGSAYAYSVQHNYFTSFVNMGINVQNTLVPDAGDSSIHDNIFANASSAVACINHQSSGGLRIINNKCNTAQYSYRLQLTGATSDLVFVGNSCENFSVAGMGFFRTSGSFNNIVIAGNQMALGPSGILMNDASAFFSTAVISGNVLTALTNSGIVIDNASDIALTGNTIIGMGGATVAGISLSAACTGVTMGPNKIRAFATPIVNNSTSGNITGFTRPANLQTTGTAAPVDLNENILFTAKIPAGAMGTAGAIKLYLAFAHTANANVKTLRVRLGGIGGTVVWSALPGATSASTTRAQIVIGNSGAANSQVSTAMTQIDAVMQNVGAIASAIDTSVATTLVVTCQKATVAGDSIVLQNATAEIASMV